MYYSITIGEYNTYDTWHLIPMERPAISPPPKKTNTVDIPGANGKLDLSNALTEYPLYDNRTGSIEFLIEPDHEETWQELYSDVMNKLSFCDASYEGQIPAQMEEDPNWKYVGLWTVNTFKSGKNYSTITLDYDLYPYKKRLYDSVSDWLWDSMNFEKGFIHNREIPDEYYCFDKEVDTDNWFENSAYFSSDAFTEEELIELLGTEPMIPKVTVYGGPITIQYIDYITGNLTETEPLSSSPLPAISVTLDGLLLHPSRYNQIIAIGHGRLKMEFTPGGM